MNYLLIVPSIIALCLLGHTIWRGVQNEDPFPHIVQQLTADLVVIITYFAIFSVARHGFTIMMKSVKLDCRSELYQSNQVLQTCGQAFDNATNRNIELEKQLAFHVQQLDIARDVLSQCKADKEGLRQGKIEDLWAFLDAHGNPVLKSTVMGRMPEDMQEEVRAVG
jgi:hypothetical protein